MLTTDNKVNLDEVRISMPAEGGGDPVQVVVSRSVVDAITAATGPDGKLDIGIYTKSVTGFDDGEIRSMFEKIQNKEHWKNPIDAVVPNHRLDLAKAAITYFHADDQFTLTPKGPLATRIQSRGYMA